MIGFSNWQQNVIAEPLKVNIIILLEKRNIILKINI